MDLIQGVNHVYVRVISYNRYMYDFPRDADGNPTWEQAPRPGLDTGLLTVRRPVIEQTFYRIEVSVPEINDPTPELVTVTFTVVDNYGGTLVAYVGADRFAAGSQIEVGSDIEFIATPADGNRVREWRVNGEIANPLARVGNVLLIENISANTSVTVAFEEIPVVPVIRTVTFIRNHDANDNTVIVTRDVEVGETLALPPAPTHAGYEFLGWFTARVGGTEFTATTVVTADLNVYARWRPTGGGIVACPPGAPGCPPEPGQPWPGQPGPSEPSLPQTGTSAIQTGLIGASILASGMIGTYVKNKKKQQKRI